MKLTKKIYIHNSLEFDALEKTTLIEASKIISAIREQNIHSCGAEDTYLNDICNSITTGISELLDRYSNEYSNE